MNDHSDAAATDTRAFTLMRKLNHDLRNPLNALLATANMLEEGIYEPLTDQQLRAVQRVERTAQRILTLLEYTVSYVKAEQGQYPVNISTFDPRRLLETVKAECQATASAKQIDLCVTTTESVPSTVQGDETVIRRIILELTWNAISFSPSGKVEITSAWSDGLVITVKDAGSGIPDSAMSNLFEPFSRGKVAGSPVPTSGSGLGLATSQALAGAIQGKLLYEKNSDKGSTFILRLPNTLDTIIL
jgi:signal transduction histidine kinase